MNSMTTPKYMSNAGDFDCHVNAAVRWGAHRSIDHIPGFSRSHWMPPSGECLHRIAAEYNTYLMDTSVR